MGSAPFEPHLAFGSCVSGRYQVFKIVRYETSLSVARAYDLVENRPVCLLGLRRELFREFPLARSQIRFHAMQMERLRSPFLLNILSWEETDSLFLLVEECPAGPSLGTVVRARRRENEGFSAREALGLGWLLCRILEEFHPVMVHGFLHPLDIYLEPWADGPLRFYPRIAHAGVRLMLRAARMPLVGLDEETASYAAPEFIDYAPLQAQVDVYGLGAILYTLLTLRPPTGPFVRPSRIRGDVPAEIDRIVLRALDDDPGERYATPGALAKALEEIGAGTVGWEKMEEGMLALRGQGDEARFGAGPRVREREPVQRHGLRAFLSDRIRTACLVLLILLNLGLLCQAAVEMRSSGAWPAPGPGETRGWESVFSRSGIGDAPRQEGTTG